MGDNATPRHYKLSNKNCSARYEWLHSYLLVSGIRLTISSISQAFGIALFQHMDVNGKTLLLGITTYLNHRTWTNQASTDIKDSSIVANINNGRRSYGCYWRSY